MTLPRKLFLLLVLPVLSILIALTILSTFWDMVTLREPSSQDSTTFVARSCDRRGPVTSKGFRYWYSCQGDLKRRGESAIIAGTVGYLKPEDIGKKHYVYVTKKGHINPSRDRPYGWIGASLAMVFLIAAAVTILRRAPYPEGSHTPTQHAAPS